MIGHIDKRDMKCYTIFNDSSNFTEKGCSIESKNANQKEKFDMDVSSQSLAPVCDVDFAHRILCTIPVFSHVRTFDRI